ncbi:MAG: hypothetical protein HY399_08175 [Elusimicrobia bacterium]|nr:hypothetical protein [Elusimicrobiota bacterium]
MNWFFGLTGFVISILTLQMTGASFVFAQDTQRHTTFADTPFSIWASRIHEYAQQRASEYWKDDSKIREFLVEVDREVNARQRDFEGLKVAADQTSFIRNLKSTLVDEKLNQRKVGDRVFTLKATPLSSQFLPTSESAEAGARNLSHLGHLFDGTASGLTVRQSAASFNLGPSRVGVLHPFSDRGSAIRVSPYVTGKIEGSNSGILDSHFKVSAGLFYLRSVPTPASAAGWNSPAARNAPPGGFSSTQHIESFYGDVGKSFSGPGNTGLSIFAGASGWQALAQANLDANMGAAASRRALGGQVTGSVDWQTEVGRLTLYQNVFGMMTEGIYAHLAYAHKTLHLAWKTAIEAAFKPLTTSIDPSFFLGSGDKSLSLQGHFQRSESPFLPSERGLIATLAQELTERITLSVSASIYRRVYAGSPKPSTLGSAQVGITIHPSWGPRASLNAQPSRPLGSAQFTPNRAAATLSTLPSMGEGQALMTEAMRNANSFSEFAAQIAKIAPDYRSLLGVLAAIGGTFGDLNYDDRNTDKYTQDPDDIYRQVRSSWFDSQHRNTGVCITQTQFNALLANTISGLNGLGISAMGAGFNVPDDHGKPSGHSLLALIGPDGQVTIQDWSGLRPMGTKDVLEAFRLYQNLQGVPAAYWDFTDPRDGRHHAYQFTPEGAELLNEMTVLGKPGQQKTQWWQPRGNNLTMPFGEQAAEKASKR